MTIIAWLMAAIGPLVIRGFLALGFTAVTFVGVSAVVASLVTSAQGYWSAMPAGVLQLATLSGIPTGLGMVFGALASLFAIRSAMGFKKYILK
jgi:cell division protein FtsX